MIPDDIVGLLEGGALGGSNEPLIGGHEGADLGGGVHTADPVVTAGDDAQELALAGTVGGNGHGGVTGALLQVQHILHGGVRGEVGIAGDKARLVALHPSHHSRLILHGLGAVDKGDAALLCQSHRQGVVGHGLHDSRHQRDIQGERGFLLALAVFHQGGAKGHIGGNAVRGGIAGHQQVLAEGVGRFAVIVSHVSATLLHLSCVISPHGITREQVCKDENWTNSDQKSPFLSAAPQEGGILFYFSRGRSSS